MTKSSNVEIKNDDFFSGFDSQINNNFGQNPQISQ